MLDVNQIYCGDCLDLMKKIDDASIDMILCDLPYGLTARNEWDRALPFEPLWAQYERIIKKNGAIVLTAIQPFASMLVTSNPKLFRYEWIWKKNKSTGFLNAKKMPLRNHENVLVFYKSLPTYNPQKTTGHKPVNSFTKKTSDGLNYGKTKKGIKGGGQTDRYPVTIQAFNVVNNDNSKEPKLHSTQKPEGLFKYMIKTYTNEGDLVLDNCAGSGTTGVAAVELGRNCILMEIDEECCKKAQKRLHDVVGSRK